MKAEITDGMKDIGEDPGDTETGSPAVGIRQTAAGHGKREDGVNLANELFIKHVIITCFFYFQK